MQRDLALLLVREMLLLAIKAIEHRGFHETAIVEQLDT